MKLSEAVREWKRNITTRMAVEYVLTLRADINAFSDAVQALEAENAKLRELVLALTDCRNTTCSDCVRWNYPEGGCSLDDVMDELGIEV